MGKLVHGVFEMDQPSTSTECTHCSRQRTLGEQKSTVRGSLRIIQAVDFSRSFCDRVIPGAGHCCHSHPVLELIPAKLDRREQRLRHEVLVIVPHCSWMHDTADGTEGMSVIRTTGMPFFQWLNWFKRKERL